jgi:hypothetical protein
LLAKGVETALSATPALLRTKKKNGQPEGKPLIYLVAGTGFEPVTFGLSG